MVVFALFAHILTAFFLDDSSLITQSASFLKVIGLSAPMIGIINIVTSYFQALGKALNSMIITLLRNVILFIPGVMLMDTLWNLLGVIATQPVVECIVMVVSIILYLLNQKREIVSYSCRRYFNLKYLRHFMCTD